MTFEISIFIDNKGNKYSIDNGLYQLLIFIKQQYTNLKYSIFNADVIIAINTSIFGTKNTHNEKQDAFFVSLQTPESSPLRDKFLSLKKTSIIFFFVRL